LALSGLLDRSGGEPGTLPTAELEGSGEADAFFEPVDVLSIASDELVAIP
jgi:hypothetical protein